MSEQPLLIGPTLDEAVAEAHQIIETAKATYPHVAVVALFSGGNDSTTLLHLCRDSIDHVLHINTGIGVEETRTFVRDMGATWHLPLIELRTDPDEYRGRVIRHGFPGPRKHREMYIHLKERRLEDLHRSLKHKRGDKVLLLSGARSYESQRRMGHAEVAHVRKGFVWANPLYYFTDWHMFHYRKDNGVPRSPVSDRIHKSGECLCGAFASYAELDELEMWYPDTAAAIHDLERQAAAAGHGKRAKWGWGANRRSRTQNAPGPMCSSCHQLPLEEDVA